MNKTLLLILVDFLLLTILSLTKWDEERSESSSSEINPETSVATMAVMEQDLLDTLTSSLQEEQSTQEMLAQQMKEREAELARREEAIQNLQSSLQITQDSEAALKKERTELQQQYEKTQLSVSELQSKYDQLDVEARQTEAQSRMLQEELDSKLQEIEAKAKALSEAEQTIVQSQQRIQELNIDVRVAKEESKFLQQNVDMLRVEVQAEREDRIKAQEQAGLMAESVSQLAEKSEDIREEIRSNTPINANQIFNDYLANRVRASFVSEVFSRGRVVQEDDETTTIFVSDGQDIFAIAHLDYTPLGLSRNPAGFRQVTSTLEQAGKTYSPSRLSFLALDPRVAAVPVPKEKAQELGGSIYYTAIEPFKFSEAVLINARGNYYGEVEFKLDADTPGYVKMQSKIFSSLFGEFSPSTGDLVFSKTGEMLGIMGDRRYCALISNLIVKESIPLSQRFQNRELVNAISSLRSRYDFLPAEVR